MTVTVAFNETMPLAGTGKAGHATLFDTSPEFHGTDSASSPLEVLRKDCRAIVIDNEFFEIYIYDCIA